MSSTTSPSLAGAPARVFIANFGRENYLWATCLARSTVATFESLDLRPFTLAGDRAGFIAHCIATKKTAAGITPTAPVASRWFNLAEIISSTEDDLWIHREKSELWWTLSRVGDVEVSEQPSFDRTEKVYELHKPAQAWSNKTRKGARLLWDALHAKARAFLFTEGTLQQLAADNASYALALIEGDDVRVACKARLEGQRGAGQAERSDDIRREATKHHPHGEDGAGDGGCFAGPTGLAHAQGEGVPLPPSTGAGEVHHRPARRSGAPLRDYGDPSSVRRRTRGRRTSLLVGPHRQRRTLRSRKSSGRMPVRQPVEKRRQQRCVPSTDRPGAQNERVGMMSRRRGQNLDCGGPRVMPFGALSMRDRGCGRATARHAGTRKGVPRFQTAWNSAESEVPTRPAVQPRSNQLRTKVEPRANVARTRRQPRAHFERTLRELRSRLPEPLRDVPTAELGDDRCPSRQNTEATSGYGDLP